MSVEDIHGRHKHKVLAYTYACAYMAWPTEHNIDINIEELKVLIFLCLCLSPAFPTGASFFLYLCLCLRRKWRPGLTVDTPHKLASAAFTRRPFREDSMSSTAITAPFNNMRTPKFKAQQPTLKCVFRLFSQYRQSNVRRLLPASDYYRARGNQIVEQNHREIRNTIQKTKLCSALASRTAEQAKNAFVGWTLNFRVCVLLKGTVNSKNTALQLS